MFACRLIFGLALLCAGGVAALATATPANADYRAPAKRASDADERLASCKRMAVMPISPCPGALDCAAVESFLIAEVRLDWGPSVVKSSVVGQKMFDLGIEKLDDASRPKLAAALDAGCFLVPSVPYVGSKLQPQTMGAFLPQEGGQVPEAHVEVLLLSADTERPIAKAEDQGVGDLKMLRLPEFLVKSLFKRAVKAAIPAPNQGSKP